MKKKTRIAALLLAVLLGVGLFSPITARAAELEQIDVLHDIQVDVKYCTTDQSAVKTAIQEKITSQANTAGKSVQSIEWNNVPSIFTQSGEITCTVHYEDATETETVPYNIVQPNGYEFVNHDINLTSASSYNKTSSTLLNYINSDLTMYGTGAEFEAAAGSVTYQANKFTWKNSSSEYLESGNTYVFSQTYNGYSVIKAVVVTTTNYSTPNISIDYDNRTISTTSDMVYSLTKSSWKSCSDWMSIPSSWYGEYVYFKYPDTKYFDGSSYTKIYIPEKANTPKEKIEYTTNSHSITITNCWDFGDVEFSINGSSWVSTNKETYTFKNLSANTTYKIYTRTCADAGDYFASDTVYVSVKTTETVSTNIDVDYTSPTTSSRIITADAVIAPSVSSEKLSGSLNSSQLSKFNKVINGLSADYSTKVFLNINHYPETNDIVTSSYFSISMSDIKSAIKNTNFELTYNTKLASVELDDSVLTYLLDKSSGSLTFNIKEITSATTSWLKTYVSNYPVYDLEIKAGSYSSNAATYRIPYTLKSNEAVSGLKIYYISNDEKAIIPSAYDATNNEIVFTTSKSGYFAIVYDSSDVSIFPFQDVKETDWSYTAIKFCYDRGIFSGTSQNTFDQSSNVSRGMIFTLLARLDGYDTGTPPTSSPYTDVAVTDWYAPGAAWARTAGIVTGKTFSPSGLMTREDIASAIYKYLNTIDYVTSSSSKTPTYNDSSNITGSAKQAVAYLQQAGIMVGNASNNFNPKQNVTRAEMATIMYRLYELIH